MANRKSIPVHCVCQICGREFDVIPSRIKQGWPKFCSRECKYKGRRVSLKCQFQRGLTEPTVTGCILWSGRLNTSGYGIMKSPGKGGRVVLAHRFSWEVANGPIPSGTDICHQCDIHYKPSDITYRRCVNSDHLSLGTKADNMAEASSKGRISRGEHRYSAKLTEEIVIEARRRHKLGESYGHLATVFGVGRQTISKAIQRLTWKHIN